MGEWFNPAVLKTVRPLRRQSPETSLLHDPSTGWLPNGMLLVVVTKTHQWTRWDVKGVPKGYHLEKLLAIGRRALPPSGPESCLRSLVPHGRPRPRVTSLGRGESHPERAGRSWKMRSEDIRANPGASVRSRFRCPRGRVHWLRHFPGSDYHVCAPCDLKFWWNGERLILMP